MDQGMSDKDEIEHDQGPLWAMLEEYEISVRREGQDFVARSPRIADEFRSSTHLAAINACLAETERQERSKSSSKAWPGPIKHPTRDDAREAIRTLLWWIGDNPGRSGLIETPERVLRAWEEDWGAGYGATFDDIKIFPDGVSPAYDQMVFVGGIEFASMCEHHLCAFTGHAAIAYIPKDGLTVGLSKFNRIVRHFSARLQVQERLTGEIAEYLSENLSPDCAVSMVATHMCIVSRGVRSASSRAITTALRGLFKDDPSTQAEFLHLARRSL